MHSYFKSQQSEHRWAGHGLFSVNRGLSPIVCLGSLAALPARSTINVIASATATARQSHDAVLFQQVAQMAGSAGFGCLGHCLILGGADTFLEPAFAAIEQAIKHFGLFGRQGMAAVCLPEARLGQHAVDRLIE